MLQQHLRGHTHLLEIGSGTGQHAAWLPQFFPDLLWQPSDVAENLQGITCWLEEADLANVSAPIALDVRNQWPNGPFQALFTANTFHIMGPDEVTLCVEHGATVLSDKGLFFIYGPFNYNQQFTSDSNAQFQQWLEARDPQSGIRDIEWVCELMQHNGLSLINDHNMPANNRLLVFCKIKPK